MLEVHLVELAKHLHSPNSGPITWKISLLSTCDVCFQALRVISAPLLPGSVSMPASAQLSLACSDHKPQPDGNTTKLYTTPNHS